MFKKINEGNINITQKFNLFKSKVEVETIANQITNFGYSYSKIEGKSHI